MAFNYNIKITNILKVANAHADGFKKGATRAAKDGSNKIKDIMREHIRSSIGGQGRFQNTLRSEPFPKPPRTSAAPAIWTHVQGSTGRPGSAAAIMFSLDRGSTIRARNGTYLAIPVDRGGRRRRFGRRRITPRNWSRAPGNRGRRLVPIEKNGRKYLIDSVDGDVEFTLLPTVSLPKRLNLDANYRKALRTVDDLAIVRISDDIIESARLINDAPE